MKENYSDLRSIIYVSSEWFLSSGVEISQDSGETQTNSSYLYKILTKAGQAIKRGLTRKLNVVKA